MLLTDYIEQLRIKIATQALYYDDIDIELEKLQYIIKGCDVFIPFCKDAEQYAMKFIEWCREHKIDVTGAPYTTENLEKAFENCSLKPKPFLYNHIRWTVEEIISDDPDKYEGYVRNE